MRLPLPRSLAARIALFGVAGGVVAWIFWPSTAYASTISGATPERYSGDPAADADGHVTPVGPRYVTRQLPAYPGDRCASVRQLLTLVQGAGLSGRPAVLFLAHLCRETGYGRSVFNSNFGNVRAFAGSNVPWHRLSDHLPYRTYLNPVEGMRAMVAVLDLSRYARAKAQLLNGDSSWYGTLGLAGYYEYRNPQTGQYQPHTAETINLPGQGQQDYNQFLAAVERCLA